MWAIERSMSHALAVCTGVQDIREVQKEINMANDTLARTDRIADEKIFKVCIYRHVLF